MQQRHSLGEHAAGRSSRLRTPPSPLLTLSCSCPFPRLPALPQQRALEMARGELGSSRSRLQLIEQELQVGQGL